MRTSYSAIETYIQCPQKYKFQEIDRIRAPKSREAIFGTLIHNTLKFMFKRDPLFPTLDEVINYFRENWPAREIFAEESKNDPLKRQWSEEDEKTYFEEGVRMLKKFYEKNAPWNFTIVDLESRFEVIVADQQSGETHILAGKIDRIDKLPDGTYEIVDYKTAKRMPSQDAINKNLQLSLYSLGLQNRWPHLKPEDIKLSLYFLKHGEKLSTVATAKTTQKTKTHLLGKINEIREKVGAGKEFEPMPSALCDWCSYRPLCPAWKHLYKSQKSEVAPSQKLWSAAPPKVLYGGQVGDKSQNEVDAVIKEYLEIKKSQQVNEARIGELQKYIKEYMEQEGLTRLFSDNGMIAKKAVQRYEYDFEKIKAILSPMGKWEEVLKADENRLKRVLREIPEEIKSEIEQARVVSKEYTVLTVSRKTAA